MSTPAAHVAGVARGDHEVDGSAVDVAGGALLGRSVRRRRSEEKRTLGRRAARGHCRQSVENRERHHVAKCNRKLELAIAAIGISYMPLFPLVSSNIQIVYIDIRQCGGVFEVSGYSARKYKCRGIERSSGSNATE